MHRDLKPENIMQHGGNTWKIIDMGFSKVIKQHNRIVQRTHVGTPITMAPEILSKTRFYGHKVDIWALGVITYYLLAMKLPFRVDNVVPVPIEVQSAAERFRRECEQVRNLILTQRDTILM